MTTIVESAPMVLFAIDSDGVFRCRRARRSSCSASGRARWSGARCSTSTPGCRRSRRPCAGRSRASTVGAHGRGRARLRRLLLAGCPTRATAPGRNRGRDRRHAAPSQRAGARPLRLPRRAHRPGEPLAPRGAPRDRPWVAPAARESRARCSTSTSTISRSSTTRSATRPATSCCAVAAPARTARGRQRPLARHGGDEFMLLLEDLPGDGRADAERVAELLRRRWACRCHAGGPMSGAREHRHRRLPSRRSTRSTCSGTPTPRCTQAKRGPRHHRALDAADSTARSRLALDEPGCARRCRRDELELRYQPVFALRDAARSSAPRRCVRWNGSRSAAWSRRPSSSRCAEDTGLIERSATGIGAR